MAKIKKIPSSETQSSFYFYCPGCDEIHAFNETWTFNNNYDKPTISPSLLVTGFHEKYGKRNYRCHSFIKDGQIQFLADCTHGLKGQTVEIPEYEED